MPRRQTYAPFRGVRTARRPQTLEELCAAYLMHADSDEFFSHATAARLWRLPLPRRIEQEEPLHVSVVAPAFPPDMRGVVGHRLTFAPRLARIGALPLIGAVDAWVQLGIVLDVSDLIVAGDALVRRKRKLATLEEISESIARQAGARGIRKVRAAFERVRPGTDSPAETQLRLLLVDWGLPEPEVGYTVTDQGYFVGTPDLAYPRERIAIEYEGEVHATDLDTFRDDIERRERFEDAGWRVIRVTADHLRNPVALVQRIRRALAQRGA